MDIKEQSDPSGRAHHIELTYSDVEIKMFGNEIVRLAIEKIATTLADQFILSHGQEVLAKMDVQAIANLAVADSAAAIRNTVDMGVRQMHQDMQNLIRDVNRPREVLTPGLFGTKRGIAR